MSTRVQPGEIYELDGAKYLVRSVLNQPDRAELRYADDLEHKESGYWYFTVPIHVLFGKKVVK